MYDQELSKADCRTERLSKLMALTVTSSLDYVDTNLKYNVRVQRAWCVYTFTDFGHDQIRYNSSLGASNLYARARCSVCLSACLCA